MSQDRPNGPAEPDQRAVMTAEMARTAFQRKAVTHLPPREALDDAIAFFQARGYRAGRTGRPNQVFVMGGREGILPRVNAEILAQGNVGRARTTMLTISGFGERLQATLREYADHLRDERRRARATPPNSEPAV
ncbi:MAG TPA: hypothetical protein VFN57_00160 [Thermomicrobiaceae bacterium]|nr:hypothetical protein [Thermomicrobiaceae bacterium]